MAGTTILTSFTMNASREGITTNPSTGISNSAYAVRREPPKSLTLARRKMSAPVASIPPNEDSLYAQLLRFHGEQPEEDEQRKPAAVASFRPKVFVPSIEKPERFARAPPQSHASSRPVSEHSKTQSSSLHRRFMEHEQRPITPTRYKSRQTSLFMAVMESAGKVNDATSHDEQLAMKLAAQVDREDLELQLRDEALARELAESLRLEALERSRRDEQIAREFENYEVSKRNDQQARELSLFHRKEEETIKRDELLARKLLKEPSQPRFYAEDEALALELMEMDSSTSRRPAEDDFDQDAALALALAEGEDTPIPPSSVSVPEQLRILEQIQSEKLAKAMPRASTPNKGDMVGYSNDIVLSQRLAMQEWVDQQDHNRGPSLNSGFNHVPSSGIQTHNHNPLHGAVEYGQNLRMGQQWSVPRINRGQSPPRPVSLLHHPTSNMLLRGHSDTGPSRHGRSGIFQQRSQIRPADANEYERPSRFDQVDRTFRSRTPSHQHQSPYSEAPPWSPPPQRSAPERSENVLLSGLLQRGHLETRTAIDKGVSHVVLCQGCQRRLHAPMSYALVFCPKCRTVSPGQTASRRIEL